MLSDGWERENPTFIDTWLATGGRERIRIWFYPDHGSNPRSTRKKNPLEFKSFNTFD